MTNNKMVEKELGRCIDPEMGERLTEYEFGFLDRADQARFEEHVSVCLYCANALYEDADLLPLIELLDEVPLEPSPRPSLWRRAMEGMAILRAPQRWAWAASLVLLIALGTPWYRSAWENWQAQHRLSVVEMPSTGYRGGSDGSWEVADARQRLAQDDYRGAAEVLERVIEKDPYEPEAAMYLGYCYLKLDNPKAAITVLERAGERSLFEDGQWLLAQAYWQAGQIAKARRALEALSQAHQRHSDAARRALEALRKSKDASRPKE